MKILFDEGVPLPLRNAFPSDTVETVQVRHWNGKTDAEVLRLAEAANFEVFITTDKNITHQQNLAKLGIGIYSLPTTSWPALKNQIAKIVAEVRKLVPSFREKLEDDEIDG